MSGNPEYDTDVADLRALLARVTAERDDALARLDVAVLETIKALTVAARWMRLAKDAVPGEEPPA